MKLFNYFRFLTIHLQKKKKIHLPLSDKAPPQKIFLRGLGVPNFHKYSLIFH